MGDIFRDGEEVVVMIRGEDGELLQERGRAGPSLDLLCLAQEVTTASTTVFLRRSMLETPTFGPTIPLG